MTTFRATLSALALGLLVTACVPGSSSSAEAAGQRCSVQDGQPAPGAVAASTDADLFVSGGARPGGDGSRQRPLASIAEAVRRAPSGASILVGPGTYRETVRIERPVRLLGQPGATIKGSDVMTGFAEGRTWTVPFTASFDRQHGQCADAEARCKLPDGVWVDGRAWRQRPEASNLGAEEFAVSGGKLHLGSNPGRRTVEVAVRQRWIEGAGDASDVTIRGFRMLHAAPRAQSGAIDNADGANWTLEGNDLSYSHALAVKLDGTGHSVVGNRIHRNGQTGIGSSDSQDLRIERNTIACNNTENFNPAWEAGGVKILRAKRPLMLDNDVLDNDGMGLWCDTDCEAARIENNRVRNNSRQGINYEIARDCLIRGNRVWGNGFGFPDWAWGAGIMLQNASDCRVTGNVVAWNADGISVIDQDRGPYRPSGNELGGNLIAVAGDGYLVAWATDRPDSRLTDAASNNRGGANRLWGDGGALSEKALMVTNQRLSLTDYAGGVFGRGDALLNAAQLRRELEAAGVPPSSAR